VLKIDRSFVSTITDRVGEALIRAVLDLAHALGIETVAEGVETEEQRSVLVALGCRHGQGHLFSRPVDGATTIRMLELAAGHSGGGRDGAGSRGRVVPVGN
jgi:EAL domain-containing protein (putative c-di-GMP-specific phosphodiesterase class I)